MSDRIALSSAVDAARAIVEQRRLAALAADEWKRPTKEQPIPNGLPEFLAYLVAVSEWSMARHALDCHDHRQNGPYRNARQEESDRKPKKTGKRKKSD